RTGACSEAARGTERHSQGCRLRPQVRAPGRRAVRQARRRLVRRAGSSDDLEGLGFVSQRAPAGMEVTAGEYGYDLFYFRRMLEARCIDVLQADATRCLGYTGFLKAAALCEAFNVPLSAHTAPHLHLPCCCAAEPLRHIEYFHDHVRIAELLFDGAEKPANGMLRVDESAPGHGLALKRSDAQRFSLSIA